MSVAPAPPDAAALEAGAAAAGAPAGDAARVRATRLRSVAWRLGVLALSMAFTVQPFGRDPDTWWHLAIGRLIGSGGIPSTEPFSFEPAAQAWVGQQWLYERLLALMVDGGGPGLAMVVLGLAGAAAFLVAGLCLRRDDGVGAGWAAGSALVCCLVAGTVLGVRGQVVTVLGTAITLLVVTRWREGSARAVWALPPLLLVWANLHAGFVTGIALALIAAVTVAVHRAVGGEETAPVRPLLLATGAAALATLANPAGVRLYGYVASTFVNPTLTQQITEWQSPNFHDMWLRLLEAVAVGLVVLWCVSGRRVDPLDVVLAVSLFGATLEAQRNMALFAVVATPQLARYGSAAWSRLPWRPRPLRPLGAAAALACAAAVAAAVAVSVVGPEVTRSATSTYEADHYPAAAVAWAQANLPRSPLLSTYEWGGYLAERLGPGEPRAVWIYGESAVFGDARLQEYVKVATVQPGWQDVIRNLGMRFAVLPRTNPISTALVATGWTALCRDAAADAVVLAEPDPIAPGRVAPLDAPAC
ncbi:MAG TPA: hypothetical protein VFO60_00480 [Candidatus Dormibacteraeota bacterium]|nr:hypothetical protein [Candidatus Dormibacteraeota bacterium]